jgi:DNA repair protein RecO (recombination protein O)
LGNQEDRRPMEWSDDGVILSMRRHGETSAIASLLTGRHGRQSGLIRGARGRASRGFLQPGSRIKATWRARLAEHLGTLTWEPLAPVPADVLDDAARLAALVAACALADAALPEREPHAAVHAGLLAVLACLADDEVWPSALVKWELGLLQALGYGLDLSACAATGASLDLAYVSPRSGRAVSRAAGAPYHGRLLALPAFLLAPGAAGSRGEAVAGLELTGYFLERNVFHAHGRALPPARLRLLELLRRTRMSGQAG